MAIIKNKSVSLGFRAAGRCLHLHRRKRHVERASAGGDRQKIRAYHDLDNMELTVPNVSRAIKDMYNKGKRPKICPRPASSSARSPGSTTLRKPSSAARSKIRIPPRARQVAMYLVRKLTNLSLPDIGKEFGRDHSTVIHSLKRSSSSSPPGPALCRTTSAILRRTSTASSDFFHRDVWNPQMGSVESCETHVSQFEVWKSVWNVNMGLWRKKALQSLGLHRFST